MAHRVRSRTAESAENKKTKVTPRRLTEKIAIMRRREHEQSEAFQKAMKSIFEMQQAQQARANTSIHSGGGSMPSLVAIDSNPVPPSIDMQSVFNDLNEVTMRSSLSSTTSRERPHSGGPTGRRSQFDKRTQSCDTDPYPTLIGTGHMEHQYLHQPAADWMEGDLSRHKSDSDLQQSLLTQQPGHPGMLNQQFYSLVHPQITSGTCHTPPPPSSFLSNKLHATPNDLGVWGKQKRPASISTAASLLSPDAAAHIYQNTLAAPGPGTASSSLPDLTNIEFESGLDVPLERDDPAPQATPLLPHLPLQQQQQQQGLMFPYQAPPTQQGGFPASNLLMNSFQANHQLPPTSYITSHAYFPQPLLPSVPSIPHSNHPLPTSHSFNHQQQLLPHYLHPLSKNIPALNLNPSSNYRPSHFSSLGPPFHIPLSCSSGTIRKGPTAQTFQNIATSSSSGGQVGTPPQSRAATGYQPPHPLLPSLLNPTTTSRPNPYQGATLGGPNIPPALQTTAKSSSLPPQMNVVIQPPRPSPSILSTSTPSQPVPGPFSPPHSSLQAQSPLSIVQSPPSPGTLPLPNNTNRVPPAPLVAGGEPTHVRAQFPISSISSLPATPTITISPGFSALPSYLAARQQQALQERFASFGMHKTEHLIRSHSEENLQQKVQKERGDLMHNPFMGNLANANSVPCVYVDSPSNENIAEICDSPTTGDSPSTSASYASSPPSVRPFWIDQQQANEFVFHGHEWPMMDSGGGGGPTTGGTTAATDKTKPGSPISHHKSLTDLNAPVEFAELSPRANRSVQLSLPSIVMSDLAMDEQGDKLNSPVVFSEYNVEDAVMDTLLKQEEFSGLQNFDMGFLTSDILMSGSPDSMLHKNLQF